MELCLMTYEVVQGWREALREGAGISGVLMEKLKIHNLSHSRYLRPTPNFSNLPNLEKLVLIDCPMLSEVSHSIGCLNRVYMINLRDCISLRNLSRSNYKLKSLKTLILSERLKIDKLEEDLEKMEALTNLVADKTAITKGFSRNAFPSIIWSWMSPTSSLSPYIEDFAGNSSNISLDLANSCSHHKELLDPPLKMRSGRR
ncbi:hypothetical protein Fmac_012290 [Flemingia macrophylla]|uniref:Uncharacterized protein n=1 Tax=Flemingia macrophylla TaxID=520843 RepID=A0ABD1MPU8_9FABA